MEQKKLPTSYEVSIYLFSCAKKPESVKMNMEINKYAKSLLELWQKAFGVVHTLALTTVKQRLKKLVKDYYKEVYIKIHRGSKHHVKEGNCSCINCLSKTSKRKIEQSWKVNNDILFDIGIKMDKLEGDEKLFYNDQKERRVRN